MLQLGNYDYDIYFRFQYAIWLLVIIWLRLEYNSYFNTEVKILTGDILLDLVLIYIARGFDRQ